MQEVASPAQLQSNQQIQSKNNGVSLKYRREIDGLRAFAVWAVVLFHAFPAAVRGGFIGVDVFFVISGFLITRIIFDQLDRNAFSFKVFFEHRARRLFPALILLMASCLAFGWYLLLADEFEQLGKHISAGTAFVVNFILANEKGYFDNAAETKPMLHLWSLAVEEQFYILWPLMLWLAWKKKFNLLKLTAGVAIASFAINIFLCWKEPDKAFFWPFGRFWELLSGSVLAWVTLYKGVEFDRLVSRADQYFARKTGSGNLDENRRSPTLSIMALGGLLMLVAGIFAIDRTFVWPGGWALVPVVGALLIIAAGSRAWVNQLILMHPIAVWFGLISYPLYLWHWPILSFLRIIEGDVPSVAVRILAVSVAVLLAWLTYRFVERPLRAGAKRKIPLVVLYVPMAVLCVAALNVWKSDGFPKRHHLAGFYRANQETSFKLLDPKKDGFCALNDKGYCASDFVTKQTVALFGDSHARQIYRPLNKFLKGHGEKLVFGGKAACPPFIGIKPIYKNGKIRDCLEAVGGWIDAIAADKDIKIVFITARAALYYYNDGYGIDSTAERINSDNDDIFELQWVADPSLKDSALILEKGMRATFDILAAANKKVVYLNDVAELGFDIKSCFPKRPLARQKSSDQLACRVPRFEFEKRNGAYQQLLDRVVRDYPNVETVDMAQALCDENYCYGKIGGHYLYRDDDHLSDFGANYLIEKISPILDSLAIWK